ncbi:MAG: hypothetical protein K6F69_08500, partial [Treponema sp.]|nr:hypothetical protein [Treponema sp.]
MNATVRITEDEDIAVYKDYCYSSSFEEKCNNFINTMRRDGKIKGNFIDNKWVCYSGVKNTEISFVFDKDKYQKNLGKKYGISYEAMQSMIKCYVCYCTGEYIFRTIAADVVNTIKQFVTMEKTIVLSMTNAEVDKIEDFLEFISTPEEMIDDSIKNIRKIRTVTSKSVRKLSPLINYLVIENEINDMYAGPISDEDFVKYFPIYFWVNITFVLPLRATEMLVTPFDCVEITDDEVVLRVRRSNLKGGGHRVHYDVDKDYDIFTYHLGNIINRQVFYNIKRYQELTKGHDRRFLFDYGGAFTNQMVSLSGFNNLVKLFIDERIKDNPKYAYAKYASHIEEFEYITAGDSRPIAMSNLYFQNAGLDLVMQLANHKQASTSESYCTNVTQTLFYSSIIEMQKKINKDYMEEKFYTSDLVIKDIYNCSSPKKLKDENYIEDCKGHYYPTCFGCKYYNPTDEEIQSYMKEREKEYYKNVKKMQNV